MRYSFYVTVHALPPAAGKGDQIELGGRRLRTLAIVAEGLATTTMDCPFQAALDRLSALPRAYAEADGSFVWGSCQGEPAWQIEGKLYERSGQVLFADLKGTCPAGEFDRLLAAFGWPETKLMFQLTREAVFLEEAEFRRFAATTKS
jgi:hypothetical protein